MHEPGETQIFLHSINSIERTALVAYSLNSDTMELMTEENFGAFGISKYQFDGLFEQEQPAAGSASEGASSSSRDVIQPDEIWSNKRTAEGKKNDQRAREVLLELMSEEGVQKRLNDKKTHKGSVYQDIACELKEMGYLLPKDPKAATEKVWNQYRQLVQNYKNYKDKSKQTGNGFVSKPACYDLLDKLLSTKHNIQPVAISDSLTGRMSQNSNREDNSKNGLKSGKGRKTSHDSTADDSDMNISGDEVNESLNSSEKPTKKKRKPGNASENVCFEMRKLREAGDQREANRERRHKEKVELFKDFLEAMKKG